MKKGKHLIALVIFVGLASLAQESPHSNALRIILDTAPISLHPRHALDAAGQRLNALVYSGLTRIDQNLEPQGDLAQSWRSNATGTQWRFRIRPGLTDHEGEPITATKIAQCLESYRVGKPASVYISSYPSWTGTQAQGDEVVVHFSAPDPYFPRNATLLRYFRSPGTDTPCAEPKSGAPLIGSGPYALEQNPPRDLERKLNLLPRRDGLRPLAIQFVRDDSTLALKLLRGDVDLAPNALPLGKTYWIRTAHPKEFDVIERNGVNVSYLAFNLEDPILKDPRIRRAIALAIDRETIVRTKYFGFAEVANSFLSPGLAEFTPSAFQGPNLTEARELLRQAGRSHLTLKYKSTFAKEGLENALLFRDQLKKIGIDLQIEVVEPAVFFASIRQGRFQIFSSRWIGVSDGSIFQRTLETGNPSNRVHYSNPKVDALLKEAASTIALERRRALLAEVQKNLLQDLPYFPLWYWKNTWIFKKGLTPLKSEELSLSGSLDPVMKVR